MNIFFFSEEIIQVVVSVLVLHCCFEMLSQFSSLSYSSVSQHSHRGSTKLRSQGVSKAAFLCDVLGMNLLPGLFKLLAEFSSLWL